MNGFQFVILVVLLLWIIHRIPSRWERDVYRKWTHDQLNKINAQIRGVPVSEIEQEFSNYISNRSAISLLRRFFY